MVEICPGDGIRTDNQVTARSSREPTDGTAQARGGAGITRTVSWRLTNGDCRRTRIRVVEVDKECDVVDEDVDLCEDVIDDVREEGLQVGV